MRSGKRFSFIFWDLIIFSKQLIKQMEIKIEKLNNHHLQVNNQLRNSREDMGNVDLKAQLLQEQSKMQQVTSLFLQIGSILGTSSPNDANFSIKLQQELEQHTKTKEMLLEEQRKSKEDKLTIEKLQKRIKDLIQSHTNTLKEITQEQGKIKIQ